MKKIYAFREIIVYVIIDLPLLCIAIYIGCLENWFSDVDWKSAAEWGVLALFALCFTLPLIGYRFINYFEIKNDGAYFYYNTFPFSWDQPLNNIDVRWNHQINVSEVQRAETVKLTEEEKRTKVYYKHARNKYLKITLQYGATKYVYVGNYANFQIKKIIRLLTQK